MQTQLRFIGEAAAQLRRRDLQNDVLPLHVEPELIHMNDIVRHPLFPDQPLYVVGREIDLIARTVTVALDLLSTDKQDSPFPFTPANLDD